MKKKTLSVLLRLIILGLGAVGVLGLCVVYPRFADSLAHAYPEFSSWLLPWSALLLLVSLPVFAALCLAWPVADSIKNDREFSAKNSRIFHTVSLLAAGDTALLFAGNLLLYAFGKNHPSVFLLCLAVCLAGCAAAVICQGLSMLTAHAEKLQQQSDLTI